MFQSLSSGGWVSHVSSFAMGTLIDCVTGFWTDSAMILSLESDGNRFRVLNRLCCEKSCGFDRIGLCLWVVFFLKRVERKPPVAFSGGSSGLVGVEGTMMDSIGFLGGGAMAEALIRGIMKHEVVPKEKIFVCDKDRGRLEHLKAMGVEVTDDGREVVRSARVVVVAVKPDVVAQILRIVYESVDPSTNLMVSIAAGVTLHDLTSKLPPGTAIVRVMPNTPCLIGEGVCAFTLGSSCQAEDEKVMEELLGSVGLCQRVPEKQLDAVTGLSGSGPAYVYMFIEALADGGVLKGLPRAAAMRMAAQLVYGSAKMVLDNPTAHPALLRNQVESPGGTTIAATRALEKGGFRAAVIDAVEASTERSRELGEKKS